MADQGDLSAVDAASHGQGAYPNFAFLVHSQTSLMQDLPPTVDTAMTARQKRRRTSPEDHAILEAAYLRNSKPDKSERLEIVTRVALGEKEVQIWFQNRRQNDRRKSRPLLPHELVPHFRNSVPQVLLGSSFPENGASTDPHTTASLAAEALAFTSGAVPERSSSRASSIHDLLNPPSADNGHVEPLPGQLPAEKICSPSGPSARSLLTQGVAGWVSKEPKEDVANKEVTSDEEKAPPSGTKRNFDEMNGQEKVARETKAPEVPSLPPHNSNVRLSISLDGAVKVKTNDEETPSPPKQRTTTSSFQSKPPGGLQRSKNAVNCYSLLIDGPISNQISKPSGGLFGRSRDARTWEFYCDGEAREALSSHAENERTGSAAGAISLIRSQSQKVRLQAMAQRVDTSNARKAHPSQSGLKPRLSRAKSSIGRLQDTNLLYAKSSARDGQPRLLRSPSGDSDKENWAPGTQLSHHPLRRQHAGTNRRQTLTDNDHTGGHASLRGSHVAGVLVGDKKEDSSRQRPLISKDCLADDSENAVEEDEKVEDLDCVQGLLSLSQGAWQ